MRARFVRPLARLARPPARAMGRLARLLPAALLLVAAAASAQTGAQAPARATPAAAAPLIVFAAASLRNVLDEALIVWQRESGATAVVSYAGTATLARQIQSGAPADVFISADQAWMDTLRIGQKVAPETIRVLARNQLVMIAPAAASAPAAGSTPLRPGGAGGPIAASVERAPVASPTSPLSDWLGPTGRLAMADPAGVPAGRYGREALESIGWYERLAGRLAFSSNVRLVLALVARGEAPLGIVYTSDATAEPRVRVAARFEAGAHRPIEYPAARVAASRHPRAGEFLDWMSRPPARALFARHGFLAAK